MSVTDIRRDTAALTFTVTSEFDATPERVWRLWSDPRKLERWWGPPGYPATVVEHDLAEGAAVRYYMTGPEGERHHGWWRVLAVEPPTGLSFEDGFADADGNPSTEMPVMVIDVAIREVAPGRTSMAITTRFPSAEAMEQITAMGMEEGIRAALGQIPALLAEEG